MNENLIYHFFSDDDFLRISEAIKENEKTTAGEIRLAIKDDIPFFGKSDVRKLAEKEFFNLGMDATRDKTGILIYVNLLLRKFYILADTGIDEKSANLHGIKLEMKFRRNLNWGIIPKD